MKPGDWRCTACNSHNFARRQSCYGCAASRPRERTGAEQRMNQPLTIDRRAGDWDCAKCQNLNFGKRDVCYQCGEPRPRLMEEPVARQEHCVICFTETADMLTDGCTHISMCPVCSSRTHKCPVCRAHYGTAKRLFRSGVSMDE